MHLTPANHLFRPVLTFVSSYSSRLGMSAVKIRESSQNLQNQAVHILLYFNSLDRLKQGWHFFTESHGLGWDSVPIRKLSPIQYLERRPPPPKKKKIIIIIKMSPRPKSMSPAFKINEVHFDLLANISRFKHFFDTS